MTNPPDSSWLQEVREFDFGEVLLILGTDKLMFQVKHAPKHLTVHLGANSGNLDIHRTTPLGGRASNHTSLFEIPHAKLAGLMAEIAPAVVAEFASLAQPLRPGWMERNRIGAVTGLIPPEAEMQNVTAIRKKRLTIDTEKVKARARAPEFLDELYDLPEGHLFNLFSCDNPASPRFIGIGFRRTDSAGRARLAWIKNRNALQAFKRIANVLESAARKHGRILAEPPWF